MLRVGRPNHRKIFVDDWWVELRMTPFEVASCGGIVPLCAPPAGSAGFSTNRFSFRFGLRYVLSVSLGRWQVSSRRQRLRRKLATARSQVAGEGVNGFEQARMECFDLVQFTLAERKRAQAKMLSAV